MRDLTFCIQGPLIDEEGKNRAQNLFGSIAKHFPQSEVIVSSWEDQREHSFPGPKFIFSSDPGSGLRRLKGGHNNINRQIVSTQAALELVTTSYAAKVRSDLLFKNNNIIRFLRLIGPGLRKSNNLSLLSGRVLVIDRHTYSPKKISPVAIPLHISDVMQFGLTSDLKKLWSIPLMSNQEEEFFLSSALTNSDTSIHLPRYRAEQYFWMQAILNSAHSHVISDQWDGFAASLPFESESFMSDNIVPAKARSLGITSQKYVWKITDDIVTSTFAFTFMDWEKSMNLRDDEKVSGGFLLLEFLGEAYRKAVELRRRVCP